MSASPSKRPAPFTYREYCLLPEDGRRHELIEGDFYVTPAPSPSHQTVSRRLQFALMQVLEEPGLAQVFNAPIDLILDEQTVVQPDLVVIGAARSHLITNRGLEGVPDLVVEILSPSSGDRDQHLKHRVYERFGIPSYWIVDPQLGTVTTWLLQDGRYQKHAQHERAGTLIWAAFPQVQINLDRVFR